MCSTILKRIFSAGRCAYLTEVYQNMLSFLKNINLLSLCNNGYSYKDDILMYLFGNPNYL